MKRFPWILALALLAASSPRTAHSFCGFFVATGDAKIFNKASQVVMVRDGDRTVLTMGSDFKGDPREFAMVVPVPTVLTRDQIHVGEQAVVDHIDQFSAPRLVEYWDPDPCMVARDEMRFDAARPAAKSMARELSAGAMQEGVRIEARYTVGEYDILILSATQSSGLESWLNRNGYTVPAGASRVLNTYIKQGLKFFVAKVNLKEQAKTGFQQLRPLQMAYESPRFMLPIRLGMANADGPQEVFVYAITRGGRVEATNYRTVKLPSDAAVPEYTKDVFPKFYQAMFTRQVQKENLSVVFLEYAWDMTWCDPCAAPPLSQQELRSLGVFWVGDNSAVRDGNTTVFLTRLHARYDAAHFPEDLVLQQTADKTNFQDRFVITHPYRGEFTCTSAEAYKSTVRERRAKEAESLALLTGWNVADIRKQMGDDLAWAPSADDGKWWKGLWK